MKKVLIVLGVLVALVLVCGGVLLWLLQDANRFKPELEALITDATDMDFKINGDLSWQLWPPVTLSGADITFGDPDTDYQLGAIGLKADLVALISGGGELKVQNIVLTKLIMTDKVLGDVTRIHRLELTDFEVGKPTPLNLQATFESAGSPDAELDLQALLTYDTEADAATLQNMDFDYDGIQGTCNVTASQLTREPVRKDKPTKDDLLPLSTFRSMDWVADCTIPQYTLEDMSIRDVSVHSENKNARSKNLIKVPELFGGSLQVDAAIDTRPRDPAWTVKTDAKDLDSQKVASLMTSKLNWAAPLLVGGTFNMTGNTAESLVASMAGGAKIDGGQGQIDIGMLKSAVIGIAQLAGKSEDVANWPDRLSYTRFTGDWGVKGTQQTLNLVLDNIDLKGTGEVNVLTEALDMALSVTVMKDATLDILKVDEALYDVPIPIRCKGTLSTPDCGLDKAATQEVLRNIAVAKASGQVDRKIDEALEDKVPEEYREDAKKLLEGIFGRKKD